MVFGYGERSCGLVEVMRAAVAMSEQIDVAFILRMHRTLLQDVEPDDAGRLRDQQVWIGGSGAGPHLAEFVPPHHEHVAEDLADLIAFIARDDVPALAHAALAHAQFETIHPFTDANGRTGRALLHAMLWAKDITDRVTVPGLGGSPQRSVAAQRAIDRLTEIGAHVAIAQPPMAQPGDPGCAGRCRGRGRPAAYAG